MANLTGITAVRPTDNTITEQVVYGATVAAGNVVYLDTSDNKHKLAQATTTTLAKASGIAMTPGVDTGYGIIAKGGSVILVGTTMAVGEPYSVSATAGAIAPDTDLTTGNICTQLGRASSATQLRILIDATEITHA